MKKIVLLSLTLLTGILLTTSCGMKKENEALMHKNDSLQTLVNSQKAMLDNQITEINNYIGFINDIQQSLNAISHKQKELTGESTEQSVITDNQKRAQLKEEINDLAEQIQINKRKVNQLSQQLSKAGKENEKLTAMVNNLQSQIAQRDKDLADLRTIIENQKTQIAGLQQDVTMRNQQIENLTNTVTEQTKSMHTAWYYIASKKDLREQGIIDKKGRIITNNDSHFTKIDMTNISEIPVDSVRKVIVISPHPMNSYDYIYTDKYITSIKITNPTAFWSLSNRFVAIKK